MPKPDRQAGGRIGALAAALGLGIGVLVAPALWPQAPGGAATSTPASQPTAPLATPVADAPPTPAALRLTYRIRPGDTYSAIAWRFYGDATATQPLYQANPGVFPRALRVGQVLRVPLLEDQANAPVTLERIQP